MALLSLLGNINSGFALGFSAIFIYQLQLEQNVTVMEESLIGNAHQALTALLLICPIKITPLISRQNKLPQFRVFSLDKSLSKSWPQGTRMLVYNIFDKEKVEFRNKRLEVGLGKTVI